MRLLVSLLLCAICPTALADYGGVWKKNCEDEMGLHIKPLRDKQYVVLFCKKDVCSQPGAYRPNTRIDGDPLYEVLSPVSLKVRYPDGGYSVYKKCGGLNGTP